MPVTSQANDELESVVKRFVASFSESNNIPKDIAVEQSIPENRPLAPPVIAPAYDPSRRVPGVGQLLDSDPFEEESMCVTFDDPASRKAREQIYAAVRGEIHVEDRSEEEKAARRREEDERLPKRSREEDDDSRRSTRRR